MEFSSDVEWTPTKGTPPAKLMPPAATRGRGRGRGRGGGRGGGRGRKGNAQVVNDVEENDQQATMNPLAERMLAAAGTGSCDVPDGKPKYVTHILGNGQHGFCVNCREENRERTWVHGRSS